MAIQLQLRRGTSAENNVFTGAVGELTMDTDTNGLRIHDGSTVGGVPIPTATTADYVVEWQEPTADNNYTWYRKYRSGWIEQGGRGGSGTSVSITMPVAMLNTYYRVLISSVGSVTEAYGKKISVSTPTSFTVVCGGNESSNAFNWAAFGMAAS